MFVSVYEAVALVSVTHALPQDADSPVKAAVQDLQSYFIQAGTASRTA